MDQNPVIAGVLAHDDGNARCSAALRRCQAAGTMLGVGCLVAGWPVVPLLQVPSRLHLTEPKGISPLGANPPITELRSGALDR